MKEITTAVRRSSAPDAATEAEVRDLARTIQRMIPRFGARDGWLPLSLVAKEFKGSQVYADLLCSLAGMPPGKRYFAVTDRAIKLTEEGHILARTAPPPSLSEVGKIADAVRQYAARLTRVNLTVNRVSRVAKVGERYVQAIHVNSEDEVIASETPCEFRPKDGSGRTRGRIIGQEPDGAVLYVALDSEVFASSLPAVLSIDRAFLLLQLVDRLRSLNALPSRMATALRPVHDTTVLVAGDDSLEVARLLAELPTPWTRFLWGPPGAGKTYGIGSLLTRLVERELNGRTLIVAPSNRAVDVALEQFLGHLTRSERRDLIRQRRVLRYGYPRKSSILEMPELLGPPELDELSRGVRQIAAEIAKAEREEGNAAKVAVLRTRMLAAQEAVKNAVTLHTRKCAVVATTSTLAYLPASPIPEAKWDNVIVDEVTMVTPAMCTYLASLASKRFLLAGDPRQLGPVYAVMPAGKDSEATDYEWMGRDIFDKSGVSRGEGEWREVNLKDRRLARITCQRRCADAIWSRVAYLYPAVENHSDAAKAESLMRLPPLPKESVVVLDTSECGQLAKCVKAHDSWQNPFNADLAMEVVRALVAESPHPISVSIIAPYRAQVRLLRRRIRQEQRALRSSWSGFEIDAGTVHQFQGSDADVILFDMVDGVGREHVGNLLKGDAGLRLVNVAFTRAKGKLVVIADRDWCQFATKDRSVNPLLHEMMTARSGVPSVAVRLGNAGGASALIPRELDAGALLYEALKRRKDVPKLMAGHAIKDESDALVALPAVALPDVRHAVFCDGGAAHASASGKEWRHRPQHRHRLTELGWTFSVFTAAEVLRDPDICAAEVSEMRRHAIAS